MEVELEANCTAQIKDSMQRSGMEMPTNRFNVHAQQCITLQCSLLEQQQVVAAVIDRQDTAVQLPLSEHVDGPSCYPLGDREAVENRVLVHWLPVVWGLPPSRDVHYSHVIL